VLLQPLGHLSAFRIKDLRAVTANYDTRFGTQVTSECDLPWIQRVKRAAERVTTALLCKTSECSQTTYGDSGTIIECARPYGQSGGRRTEVTERGEQSARIDGTAIPLGTAPRP
jgi:hypothetical protein